MNSMENPESFETRQARMRLEEIQTELGQLRAQGAQMNAAGESWQETGDGTHDPEAATSERIKNLEEEAAQIKETL